MSQAAGRALDLLKAVGISPEPKALMDLVAMTEIDKATSARLLRVLEDRGLVYRDPQQRRYRLGAQMYALVASAGPEVNTRAAAAHHMSHLRDLSGETVSLHQRVGNRRVCVDGRESAQDVRRVLSVGQSLSLLEGPSGKVLAAYLDEHELAACLDEVNLSDDEARTLRNRLGEIREVGYSLTEGDRTPGVRAISAPILVDGAPVASLTVAGPAERWTASAAADVAPELMDAVKAISGSLHGGDR